MLDTRTPHKAAGAFLCKEFADIRCPPMPIELSAIVKDLNLVYVSTPFVVLLKVSLYQINFEPLVVADQSLENVENKESH